MDIGDDRGECHPEICWGI